MSFKAPTLILVIAVATLTSEGARVKGRRRSKVEKLSESTETEEDDVHNLAVDVETYAPMSRGDEDLEDLEELPSSAIEDVERTGRVVFKKGQKQQIFSTAQEDGAKNDVGRELTKEPQCNKDLEGVQQELDEALGKIFALDSIKASLRSLIQHAIATQETQERTIPSNFAFVGPPGTGKTTISKILSKAFCKLGMVKHGGFLEARPDDAQIQESLQAGLGGVIFIDEAYLLKQKAVEGLIKLLEEHQRDSVFIFAGYEEDTMENFFEQNDLRRYIPQTYHFKPFSVDDLLDILVVQAKHQHVGFLPSITKDEINMLIEEYSMLKENDPGVLPAPSTDERGLSYRGASFLAYAESRVGMMYHYESTLEHTHEGLKFGQIPMEFQSQVPLYEQKVIKIDMRKLLEQIPASMREKMNGWLLDTIFTKARTKRSVRVRQQNLVIDKQCQLPLVHGACVVDLFYTFDDLEKITSEIVNSPGSKTYVNTFSQYLDHLKTRGGELSVNAYESFWELVQNARSMLFSEEQQRQ